MESTNNNQPVSNNSVPQPKKNQFAILFSALVVLAVVSAIIYAVVVQRPITEPVGDTSNEVTAPLLAGDNAVYVPGAKPGTSVTVGLVVFETGGYVVIHEDENGRPGAILGASELLPEGPSERVVVSLSRESVEGEALYAMLHADNGDGIFDPADDAPIIDDAGSIIMMQFPVSQTALEPGAITP